MSNAELGQLSRINDKLDQGFGSLGTKLDCIDRKLDQGFGTIGAKVDQNGRKLDRIANGQEQVINLLAEQVRLLRQLVPAAATLGNR